MISISDVMTYCTHMTSQELEDFTWEHFKVVRDYLESKYSTKEADEILFENFAVCAAIDGVFTEAEFELLRVMHGFCYAEYKSVEKKVKRSQSNRDIVNAQKFFVGLSFEAKSAFLMVAIALLASDGGYTQRELALLESFLQFM